MNAYLNDLFSQMKTIDVLHDEYYNYDMGSVIAMLFKEESKVEQLLYHKVEDYSGEAIVVYRYNEKYFCLKESFGSCSGCDDWDSNSLENHTRIIDGLKQDIAESLVDHIYEITLPLERYAHPYVRDEWIKVLKDQGDGNYEKCAALAQKLDQFNEEEREHKKKEYEAGEERLQKEREAARVARIKRDNEVLQDVVDVITYLENNTRDTDPFFQQKVPSKVKVLKYHVNQLNDDILIRAQKILDKFQ